MKKSILFSLLLIIACPGFNQIIHRQLPAIRTSGKIVIDGEINDSAWISAAIATDFIEWRPDYGKKENESNKTEVKLLYDNTAIYIAGFCHEQSKDSIATELVGRDVVGVNDFIGVLFDTYHDGINGFGYYVTPLGEQFDAKYSSTGEDASWNSVYYTATKMVDGGWTFEMRIPYSAIRFSSNNQQTWGINITRKRTKSGKQLMWNPTDPKIQGLFNQAGQWTNIENIKPPIRLSLSPYFSTYVNHYPYNQPGVNNFNSSVNGGMDVKYGINQSFTLDMTLVPDFGQVQSDNQVLNLTPYEVKYNENRTFFTEGTDLFSKGNLFYSRRIGSTPIHFNDINVKMQSNETMVKNPTETKMINGAKVSGRTSGGLGIGIFNAIVGSSYATVEDDNKVQRKIETSPITNYNIVVLDQALKHNSSVSFINTNVLRSGPDYDANVTAALFDIYDKNVNYNVWGKVGVSQLIGYNADKGNLAGYNHNLSFGKMKGNFTWSVTQSLADNNYQQNDMGYSTTNNYLNHNFWAGYKMLKPKKFYNNLYFNLNGGINKRFQPAAFQNVWFNTNVNGTLKNLWDVIIQLSVNGNEYDFYEPRIAGKVFKRPYYYSPAFGVSTNSAKKYSLYINAALTRMPDYNTNGLDLTFSQQFRFNKKLTISNSATLEFKNRDLGFATIENNNSIFGLRNRRTVENIFNIKYNFNNKMGLSFRARHYWSKVNYIKYFNLQDNGLLVSRSNILNEPNYNVNFFNIDMVYTWQFAQGSFINLVWKDAASVYNNSVHQQYFKNFQNTWKEPQANSLSLRVIYYLDYLSLKKKH